MRPAAASSPVPSTRSSISSWYDGVWPAGTSTCGLLFVSMASRFPGLAPHEPQARSVRQLLLRVDGEAEALVERQVAWLGRVQGRGQPFGVAALEHRREHPP